MERVPKPWEAGESGSLNHKGVLKLREAPGGRPKWVEPLRSTLNARKSLRGGPK